MVAQNDKLVAARIRGLYAITPEKTYFNLLEPMLDEAFRAGVRLLQYRRKNTTHGFDEAERCCRMAHASGATFIVNDHLDLAVSVNADGVHWGKDDVPMAALAERIRDAKSLRGANFIVGVSCYNDLSRATAAVAAGADYVAFGSMFASPTKPNAPQAGLDTVRAARRTLGVPIVAIGGITRDNAATVIAAGADALAVIADLFPSAAETVPGGITAQVHTYLPLFENC